MYPHREIVQNATERELGNFLRTPHRYTPEQQDIIEARLRELRDPSRLAARG